MGRKAKPRNGNPWAICTAAVGRKDKKKFERCVKKVKKSLGMKNPDDWVAIGIVTEPRTDRKLKEVFAGVGIPVRRFPVREGSEWSVEAKNVDEASVLFFSVGGGDVKRTRGLVSVPEYAGMTKRVKDAMKAWVTEWKAYPYPAAPDPNDLASKIARKKKLAKSDQSMLQRLVDAYVARSRKEQDPEQEKMLREWGLNPRRGTKSNWHGKSVWKIGSRVGYYWGLSRVPYIGRIIHMTRDYVTVQPTHALHRNQIWAPVSKIAMPHKVPGGDLIKVKDMPKGLGRRRTLFETPLRKPKAKDNARAGVEKVVKAFFEGRSAKTGTRPDRAGHRYKTDGETLWQWGNRVAEWSHPNRDSIWISDAGYRTVTTRNLLNAILAEAHRRRITPEYKFIHQRRYEWFINGDRWTGTADIGRAGVVVGEERPVVEEPVRRRTPPPPPPRPTIIDPGMGPRTLLNAKRNLHTGREVANAIRLVQQWRDVGVNAARGKDRAEVAAAWGALSAIYNIAIKEESRMAPAVARAAKNAMNEIKHIWTRR